VIGTTATLQNSQCAIAVGSSSKSDSGAALTLNLAMTFKAAFAGAKNVFMYATNGTQNSGWQDRGDWTVPGPPAAVMTAVSATPNTGSGATQTCAADGTAASPDLRKRGRVQRHAAERANTMVYYDRPTTRCC
jgi:hypothetical protein